MNSTIPLLDANNKFKLQCSLKFKIPKENIIQNFDPTLCLNINFWTNHKLQAQPLKCIKVKCLSIPLIQYYLNK